MLARIARLKPGSGVNLADDLEGAVDRHASRAAILFEDERWTYADLERRANRYAAWALDQGLKPGATVALFMENRPDYLAIWFGMAKVGLSNALINTQPIPYNQLTPTRNRSSRILVGRRRPDKRKK